MRQSAKAEAQRPADVRLFLSPGKLFDARPEVPQTSQMPSLRRNTMSVIILTLLLGVAVGLIIGMHGIVSEQRQEQRRLDRDLGIARDEVKALTSAIARANKTPVNFDKGPKVLEPGDSYFDGKARLEKITAG
jgi:hypothetical protein